MKILACDLDGTLVTTSEKLILKENLDAIKKLRKNGDKFIISTGRDLLGTKSILDDFPELEFDYLVLCNGALILDKNYNVLYRGTVSHETAISIYNQFKEIDDAAMYLSYEEGSTVFYEGEYDNYKDFLGTFKNINKYDLFDVPRDYNIISVFSKSKNEESTENIKNLLSENYGEALSIFRNQTFVDLMAKDCSKGLGLKKVIEMENWLLDDLYSIGDSFNDISMFEITNNSFTFNDSTDTVKSFANFKVDFVHECINHMLSN